MLALSSSALGAGVDATLAVRGGSLTVSPVTRGIAIASVPRTSADRRRTVRRVWVTVADRRGTGSGWGLTLTAGLRSMDGHHVPAADVSVWRVSMRCGTSCTRPRGVGTVPVRIAEHAPTRIVAARSRSGMGTVRLRIDLAVTLPADAPAGPYVLLPRLTRVSGP